MRSFLCFRSIIAVCGIMAALELADVFSAGTYAAECCECHGEICNDGQIRTYVHTPFQQKKCEKCHMTGGYDTNEVNGIHMAGTPELSRLIDACMECHHNIRPGASHPVNVAPGRVIPSEYPLIDGKIGCMSCHDSHGSEFSFRLIKPRDQLCAGCHPGY